MKFSPIKNTFNDEEWSQWSDSEIARKCAVSTMMVGKYRLTIKDLKSTKRKGKDGRIIDTSNIGKRDIFGKKIRDEFPEDDNGYDLAFRRSSFGHFLKNVFFWIALFRIPILNRPAGLASERSDYTVQVLHISFPWLLLRHWLTRCGLFFKSFNSIFQH